MSTQYIFTMYKLSRVHSPDKRVLEDISLSFLPGAKIGVLGPNGSGKSTLLRIMAGEDTDYRGDAQLAPGATVGLLEQEPQLDPSKDVRGNVEEGVAEQRAILDRFNTLSARFAEDLTPEQMEKVSEDFQMTQDEMEHLIRAAGYVPKQRTNLYERFVTREDTAELAHRYRHALAPARRDPSASALPVVA